MWNTPSEAPEAPQGGDGGAVPAPGARIQLRILRAGLRLSVPLRQDLQGLPDSPAAFWFAVALALVCDLVVDYLAAEPPRMFSKFGLENDGLFFLLTLLICRLLAGGPRIRVPLWTFAALITYAAVVPDALMTILAEHFSGPKGSWLGYYALLAGSSVWLAAQLWQALAGFGAGGSTPRRSGLALLGAGLVGACAYLLPSYGLWETDYAQLFKARGQGQRLVAEDVLAPQQDLLAKSVAAIAPGEPGKPRLYFLAYAPYASQAVFAREAQYTVHQFETRFAAQGRALALVNSMRQPAAEPLATVTNLRAALQALGHKMIPDQDILFLFFTSHGSKDGELAEDLPGVGLDSLDGKRLSGLLDEAGIRWRVIVVSSCYSGTFVEPLRNDHTLIMTAARADRTSFGCSSEADFTYFGRAYFQQALNQTASFTDAFDIARRLIGQWETEQKLEHAEPQIAVGQLIQARLAAWRATLPASSTAPADAVVLKPDGAAAAKQASTAAAPPPSSQPGR